MLLSLPMILAGAIIIVVAWRRETPKQITIPDQGTP
jgi:prolipoprotein diacylglyceryltransferase